MSSHTNPSRHPPHRRSSQPQQGRIGLATPMMSASEAVNSSSDEQGTGRLSSPFAPAAPAPHHADAVGRAGGGAGAAAGSVRTGSSSGSGGRRGVRFAPDVQVVGIDPDATEDDLSSHDGFSRSDMEKMNLFSAQQRQQQLRQQQQQQGNSTRSLPEASRPRGLLPASPADTPPLLVAATSAPVAAVSLSRTSAPPLRTGSARTTSSSSSLVHHGTIALSTGGDGEHAGGAPVAVSASTGSTNASSHSGSDSDHPPPVQSIETPTTNNRQRETQQQQDEDAPTRGGRRTSVQFQLPTQGSSSSLTATSSITWGTRTNDDTSLSTTSHSGPHHSLPPPPSLGPQQNTSERSIPQDRSRPGLGGPGVHVGSSTRTLRSTHAARRSTAMHVFDRSGHVMTEAEKAALWRAAGKCTKCGAVTTHAKVKHGPFRAFRRMEALTIPGRVYKGYCLGCYDLGQVRQLLGEPENSPLPPNFLNSVWEGTGSSGRSSRDGGASGAGGGSGGVVAATGERGARDDMGLLGSGPTGRTVTRSARGSVRDIVRDFYDDDDIGSARDVMGNSVKRGSPMKICLNSFRVKACLIVFFLALFGAAIGVAIGFTARGGENDEDDTNDSTIRAPSPRPPAATPTPRPTRSLSPTMTPSAQPTVYAWDQVGPDIRPPPDLNLKGFGCNVVLSSDGSRLVVSAPGDGESQRSGGGKGTPDGGWVQVYQKANTGDERWIELGDPILGEVPGNMAGLGVDLSGDGTRLAVGFPGNGNGFVRVYEYYAPDDDKNGTSSNEEEADTNTPRVGSLFNRSSPNDVATKNRGGGFHRNVEGDTDTDDTTTHGKWLQIGQTLIGPDDGGEYGRTIALSDTGTLLAVGAPKSGAGPMGPQSGQVRVYSLKNETSTDKAGATGGLGGGGDETAETTRTQIPPSSYSWEPLGQVLNGQHELDLFGTGLDMSGNGVGIAIGAIGNDDRGDNVGYVKVYYYDDTEDEWVQDYREIFGDDVGDGFGAVVSMSTDAKFYAASARLADSGDMTDTGHVRVYFRDTTFEGWFQQGFDLDGINDGDHFGNSLSCNGDCTKFIAASRMVPGKNGERGRAGTVQVYFNRLYDEWELQGIDLGGQETGLEPWISGGPAVSMAVDGKTVAVGYESLYESGEEIAAVRVFRWRGVPGGG